MEEKLKIFAKILLKEKYSGFENILSDFERDDPKDFIRKYRKMISSAEFDADEFDDIDEVLLFMCFAKQEKRMAFVDWSGEEYDGQVKRSITAMLNSYGQSGFDWNRKKFDASLNFDEMKRGDYIPLMFSSMNESLSALNYCIVIFDDYSDTYKYCVLHNDDLCSVTGLSTEQFFIVDTKIYAVYLQSKGNETGKILLYLKNKFSVPLSEIKNFANQPGLLLATGNLKTVMKEKAEIEKLGGTVRVEEIISS